MPNEGGRWTSSRHAAGLSRRLLVGIEQTDANPSLSTLLKLATALGISLTELLEDQSQDRPVGLVTQDEAITLWSTDAGSHARLLVSRGPLELWAWTLEPGDQRDSHPHRPGAVELLAVHDGTLTLEVGDDRIEVRAGDSAWFDATHPHAYKNETADPTRFTLVGRADMSQQILSGYPSCPTHRRIRRRVYVPTRRLHCRRGSRDASTPPFVHLKFGGEVLDHLAVTAGVLGGYLNDDEREAVGVAGGHLDQSPGLLFGLGVCRDALLGQAW